MGFTDFLDSFREPLAEEVTLTAISIRLLSAFAFDTFEEDASLTDMDLALSLSIYSSSSDGSDSVRSSLSVSLMGLLGSAVGSIANTFLAELAGIYFLPFISSGGGVIRVSLESFSLMISSGFRLLSGSKF